MLEKQSLDEFLLNIDKGKAVIVSLSPQSRASLAVHFGISQLQVILQLVLDLSSLPPMSLKLTFMWKRLIV